MRFLVILLLLPCFTLAKPNVVLIYIDDLGYGELGCYGGKDIPTPHVDRLAKEGVRFTASHITNPPCCPSRCALIMGQYGQRFGKYGMSRGLPIPEDRPTLAKFMTDNGYVTGQIGKWDIGSKIQGPLEVGFTEVAQKATEEERLKNTCVPMSRARPSGLQITTATTWLNSSNVIRPSHSCCTGHQRQSTPVTRKHPHDSPNAQEPKGNVLNLPEPLYRLTTKWGNFSRHLKSMTFAKIRSSFSQATMEPTWVKVVLQRPTEEEKVMVRNRKGGCAYLLSFLCLASSPKVKSTMASLRTSTSTRP